MGISNYNKSNQSKKNDLFKQRRSLNKKNENMSKSERLMEGIGVWTSYYRLFPHIFCRDVLGIRLKCFQQILIYFMMHFNYFMYLASRGQGKSFLTAIFCCVRCILFPESKIIVAAGQKSQAIEVLEKIDELRRKSHNLAREIDELKTGANDARCNFKNGSWIRVVASNQGARSKRANVIVVDEFRMVDKTIIDTVLRKFMTAPRQPKYLEKPEYSHLKERNKELYLSSCWFKHHWSWDKVKAYAKSILDGKSYFVCSLPYQLAIKENLLDRRQVEDEMGESDFSPIGWLMEMEALFYGESEKAFFKYEDLEKNRVMTKPIYPKSFYNRVKDKDFKYEPKKEGEIRVISCDIAGMAGNANDASVYTLLRLIPNKAKTSYDKYVSYMESLEGGHATIQALRIRRLYEEFDCDYIAIDTQSFGLGIYDQLCQNLYDKELDIDYEAFSCINDEAMANRCLSSDAPKVIYSIKANANLNSEANILLRDSLKRNKLRLLTNENEGREFLNHIKKIKELPEEEKTDFLMPYIQTNFLVNEMINLERVETDNNLIKLKEPSNRRKDRFSSLLYANYVAKILESNLKVKKTNDINISQLFQFTAPRIRR